MQLRPIKPLGIFHARVTRDGAAVARDGQVYVLMNEMGSFTTDQPTELEIMFEDGVWMLVGQDDLTPFIRSEP